MKHFSKKVWIVFSFIIVATSAIFAFKKLPFASGKSAKVVVDRLINLEELVCKAPAQRDSGRFTRGMLALDLPAISVDTKRWEKARRGERAEDYCRRTPHKLVTGRDGKKRGDNNRPIGGDFRFIR